MDIQTLILIPVTLINIFLGILLYFHRTKKTRLQTIFILLVINVALWTATIILYRIVESPYISEIYMRMLYVVALFIPSLFLYFTILFTKFEAFPQNSIGFFLLAEGILLSLGVWFSDAFVVSVRIPPIGEKIIYFGEYYFFYALHHTVVFGFGFLLLLREYWRTDGDSGKKQIFFVFLGTFASSVIAMATNLILPWIGYFELNWAGNVMTVFFVGFLLYSIIRYKLFEVKVILTEILVFILIFILAVDLFTAESNLELLVKTVTLVLVTIFSYSLIRSVNKEIDTRIELERLANDLQRANERLKELDRQKSEFVSIASHQLRSPLTAIKGYSSMLLEEGYGKIPYDMQKPIQYIFHASKQLVNVVEDFLNITRIEQGRMSYQYTDFDLVALVRDVIGDIELSRKEKNITICLKTQREYKVHADEGKIRQAVLNLLDNAVKYSPEGSTVHIHFETKKQPRRVILSIRDEGIGISPELKKRLFQKFSRGEESANYHANGSGIGLYLGYEIVKAHGGSIWVESKGKGKGATFFVELPAGK